MKWTGANFLAGNSRKIRRMDWRNLEDELIRSNFIAASARKSVALPDAPC